MGTFTEMCNQSSKMGIEAQFVNSYELSIHLSRLFPFRLRSVRTSTYILLQVLGAKSPDHGFIT
jgi:hypothetical protein